MFCSDNHKKKIASAAEWTHSPADAFLAHNACLVPLPGQCPAFAVLAFFRVVASSQISPLSQLRVSLRIRFGGKITPPRANIQIIHPI
jgi:hypothetical protein